MLRKDKNKGDKYQYRYIDKSVLQDPVVTNFGSRNVKNMINQFSLYDWIISGLNKAGATCCNDYSGDTPVPTESDVHFPASLFSGKTFTTRAKGHDEKLDLFAAIAVVMNDVCGKSINQNGYKLNATRLKQMEVPSSLVVSSRTTALKSAGVHSVLMPNGAVSLDALILHYVTLVSACDVPTVTTTVTDTVITAVTVLAEGLRADGVTAFTAADAFIMTVQLGTNPAITMNSGNPIEVGTTIAAGDVTALNAIGVESIGGAGNYDDFTFSKNPTPTPALAEDLTFCYIPVEDYAGVALQGLVGCDIAATNGTN